MQYVLKIQIQM